MRVCAEKDRASSLLCLQSRLLQARRRMEKAAAALRLPVEVDEAVNHAYHSRHCRGGEGVGKDGDASNDVRSREGEAQRYP